MWFLFLPILWLIVHGCEESLTTVSGNQAPQGTICKGSLIFEDNFNTLDLKKWQHELTLSGGGNWEFQWYNNNRTNSYVEAGILHIKPTLLADQFGEKYLYSGTLDINGGAPADRCTDPQSYGCSRTGNPSNILNPIKSAKIRTVDSFSFKYGKVEVSAKIPSGDWLWPAIWMMPRYSQYSTWPSSGEIDIMESRGNTQLIDRNGAKIGVQQVGSTLHWGPNPNFNRQQYTHFSQNNDAGYDQNYHKYQLEWTPDNLTFSIDDRAIGTVTPPQDGGFWRLGELDKTGMENPWKRDTKMAPFDQEFYLIINLAVGGVNYFSDNSINSRPKPWKNTSPTAAADFWRGKNDWYPTWHSETDSSHMKVDYVRVWAL